MVSTPPPLSRVVTLMAESVRRVLDRVVQQVVDHLVQPLRVRGHGRDDRPAW